MPALEQLGDGAAQRRERRFAQALKLGAADTTSAVTHHRRDAYRLRFGRADAQLQRRVQRIAIHGRLDQDTYAAEAQVDDLHLGENRSVDDLDTDVIIACGTHTNVPATIFP